MPVSDPIGDLLTRMRNAQSARSSSCAIPWSRQKEELLKFLQAQEWVKEVSTRGEGNDKECVVMFRDDNPALTIKRISKPGRRVYEKSSNLKPVLRGYGVSIISTSSGLMTDKEARAKKVGGEVLCTIS